eukprot:gene16763-19931_t
MVLELNASDDRGIDVVREQIKSFASSMLMFTNHKYKLIILDEADAMTNHAQTALRRVIEKYTKTTRFCLVCNYVIKIIPALQSRCTRFRFGPLPAEPTLIRLKEIIAREGLKVREDALKSVVSLAEGDMRKSLNILQAISMTTDEGAEVNKESIYRCTGLPMPSDIKKMVDWLLNDDYQTAYENMIKEIHIFVLKVPIDDQNVLLQLLVEMADIEYNLSVGSSEKLQLGSLVGSFQLVRESIA